MVRIRQKNEDFEVEEIALYPPLDEGDHAYLWVEKSGRSTTSVADELADLAEVSRLDVGFAGRKDRWAICRQWFSVRGLDPDRASGFVLSDAEILEVRRHRNKLRPGHLSGNRFRIVVRDVDEGQAVVAGEVFARIMQEGMLNRFGRQRFGRDGSNAERGAAILGGERVAGSKRHRRFLASALQSRVFNGVLDRRCSSGLSLLEGDLALVRATGGLFEVRDPKAELERFRRFDISPTGPLFGCKMRRPSGSALAIEDEVLAEAGVELDKAEPAARRLNLYGARRPLTVPVEQARMSGAAPALTLEFTLPAGSYATVLLEQLFGAEMEEGPCR